MAGYILIAALAAFGTLSVLWAALGWLLPSGRGCALVCAGQPDEGILSRYRWLRAVGLFSGPLIAVTEEGSQLPGAENCRPEDLLPRLEWERTQIHGTGIGDPAGCHQHGGISEL